MKLPDSIKIGGIYYSVTTDEMNKYQEDTLNLGRCHLAEQEIVINSGLPDQRAGQTLVHEMLHALFFEAGIVLEDDEDLVNRASIVLYQVLKDNDFSYL